MHKKFLFLLLEPFITQILYIDTPSIHSIPFHFFAARPYQACMSFQIVSLSHVWFFFLAFDFVQSPALVTIIPTVILVNYYILFASLIIHFSLDLFILEMVCGIAESRPAVYIVLLISFGWFDTLSQVYTFLDLLLKELEQWKYFCCLWCCVGHSRRFAKFYLLLLLCGIEVIKHLLEIFLVVRYLHYVVSNP